MADFSCPVIGWIKSPFADKFAVPRQPNLAPSALAEIFFYKPYSDPQAFFRLDSFSHLHVLFVFDRLPDNRPFKAMVRPPRLGGNAHVGVFASRSPFRPSRIGLSVVKLEEIRHQRGEISLLVSGADLVDGSKILDIKPYIPFVDAIASARGGFAQEPAAVKKVEFSEQAEASLETLSKMELQAVTEVLSQDPRPAYKDDAADPKIYHATLYNFEFSFYVRAHTIFVSDARKLPKEVSSVNPHGITEDRAN